MSWSLSGFKKHTMVLMFISTLMLSGCIVYQVGGAKAYDTQRPDIKYMCKNVYGIFWSDIVRSECFYATNVQENGLQYSYYPFSNSAAEQLGLQPNYGFWSEYGKWIILAGFILVKILGAAADSSSTSSIPVNPTPTLEPGTPSEPKPGAPLRCPHCGLPYRHEENLREHILTSHPDKSPS